MWYISTFEAKENVTMEEIQKERDEWIKQGKDNALVQKCRTVQRYEVLGKMPLRVIFVIDTDDPCVLNMLSHHFGNLWNSVSYPVAPREISEALQDDCTIIGG